MVRFALIFAQLIFLAATIGQAAAEKRVALVIGNGAYTSASPLPNPSRDAEAIEKLFKNAGFEFVQRATDLKASAMRKALRDFSEHARTADIAVIFYAGHGIEVGGINYLIPVDAALERDVDVADEAVSLERAIEMVDQAKRLRLVILDACRDNPFVRTMKRTLASRTIGRGLAEIEIRQSDTLVAYATRAGSVAADGENLNSPFTLALLEHLMTPGLDVRLALGRVRDQVRITTGGRQEPFVYGSLGGAEVALVPSPPLSPNATGDLAAREWLTARDTNSIAVLEQYLVKHKGNAFYAALANERLAMLRRREERDCTSEVSFECIRAGRIAGIDPKHLRISSCADERVFTTNNIGWKDIWTTSVFSYLPGHGGKGPGGGLENDILGIGGWGDWYQTLIQFDTPSKGPTAPKFVALLLHAVKDDGAPVEIHLDRIARDWAWTKGDRLWWKDKPNSIPIGTHPAPQPDKWYAMDITQLVRQWSAGEFENHGILLRPASNNKEYSTFRSSRAADAGKRPRLLVCK